MKALLTFLSVALVLTFAVGCSDMETPIPAKISLFEKGLVLKTDLVKDLEVNR